MRPEQPKQSRIKSISTDTIYAIWNGDGGPHDIICPHSLVRRDPCASVTVFVRQVNIVNILRSSSFTPDARRIIVHGPGQTTAVAIVAGVVKKRPLLMVCTESVFTDVS